MGTTFRYLSTVEEGSEVLDWFRARLDEKIESVRANGSLFYFRNFGPLLPDATKTPLVSVFIPERRRGVLTTIGEVHFLATPQSAFPELAKINRQFRKWLSQHTCVHSHRKNFERQWDHLLEGSSRNWDSEIYALPGGMKALQNGSYFVSLNDNDSVLDRICHVLWLRGVEGVVR